MVLLQFSHPGACVAVSPRVLSIHFVCAARRSLLVTFFSPHQCVCMEARLRLPPELFPAGGVGGGFVGDSLVDTRCDRPTVRLSCSVCSLC